MQFYNHTIVHILHGVELCSMILNLICCDSRPTFAGSNGCLESELGVPMSQECSLAPLVAAAHENAAASLKERGLRFAFSMRRFGRRCLMLTAVAAASSAYFPAAQARGPHRHAAHLGYSRVMGHTGLHLHRVAHRQHRRSVVSRPGIVRPVMQSVAIVHKDKVPLANTAWDKPHVSPVVLHALERAASATGVDPDLLAAIAWRESRFDPHARNQHSSAAGLLQFTDETWLRAVLEFGPYHEAAVFAAAIHKDKAGHFSVPDRQARAAIMALRGDPVLSANLAAESIVQQRTLLQKQLNRAVTPTDLYLLHVLGSQGAARFIQVVATTPTASSLQVANAHIMRNAGLLPRDGRPLTAADTYDAIATMLQAQHDNLAPIRAAEIVETASAPERVTAEISH